MSLASMKLQVFLTAPSLVLAASSLRAAEGPTDGHKLLSYCEEALKDTPGVNPFRAGYCMAFIEGTLRGWEAAAYVRDAPTNYCITPGTTLAQSTAAVTKHLRENPGELRGKGEILVIGAIQKTFTCVATRKPNVSQRGSGSASPGPNAWFAAAA